MDISTMSAKLLRGDYTDRYAFRSDFKLIVSNAILYNRVGIVVDLVLKLDSVFDKQWQRVEATLQRMGPKPTFSFAAAAPGPPPGPAPAPDPTPIVITLPYAPTPSPTVPAPVPAYVAAPAPVLAPAPPPTLPPIRLVSNAAPSTPHPAPSTTAPAPPPPLTTSLSFKLKLAGSSDTSPYATPVPEVVKPKGFKITLGGSSLLSTPTPKPPKAPKALHLSGDAEYGGGDSYRSSDGSGKHKSKKGKERAAFSYAEDDLAPPIPASYLEPYEPPADLPSMSKWINFDLPVDMKRAKSIMAKMRELPESFFFLLPVEPVGALATCVYSTTSSV
jgi:transcription initiation factor TFIID subunit 2